LIPVPELHIIGRLSPGKGGGTDRLFSLLVNFLVNKPGHQARCINPGQINSFCLVIYNIAKEIKVLFKVLKGK